jgi:sulfopyruvate decarboxylase TPP-binding subunit
LRVGTDSPWQEILADALIEAGVEVAAWVPDKRLAPIGTRLAERGIALRTLTREEECFGFAAGYRAAGGMPVVLAQCSGLGNSLNAIGSLVIPYGLAFPVVLSMRGTLGERNPAQMPLVAGRHRAEEPARDRARRRALLDHRRPGARGPRRVRGRGEGTRAARGHRTHL